VKEFLSQNNIEFLYIDITDSMLNLKKFLKYRDNRLEFEEIRKSGRVGIPCVMINKGEKFIFQQSELNELISK
jgi:glutaredoxin-related protein